MISSTPRNIDHLDARALRALAGDLMVELGEREQALAEHRQLLVRQEQMLARHRNDIRYKDAKIAQLTHEIAGLRRFTFGKRGEQLSGAQGSLLEETVCADIAAIEVELDLLRGEPAPRLAQQPKRAALPEHLPRVELHHEPDSIICQCGCQLKRIGEDVSEKLDYTPGVFHVERHIRGKWACAKCQTLLQAPVPAEVIDKDGWPQPQPWKCDTLNIAPGERWDVVVNCTNPGTWAFHCHILPHAESEHGMFGMVTALIVEKPVV